VAIYNNVVKMMGDQRTPFQTAFFEMCIKKGMEIPDDEATPCFSSYERYFREQQLQKLFVEDVGDIGSDEEFEYTVPCGVAHPHICATRDREYIANIHEAAKELRKFLGKSKVGSGHCVWLTRAGQDGDVEESEKVHFWLSHFRGGGPKIAVLALATLNDDYVLEARSTKRLDDFVWNLDITLCGRYFVDLQSNEIELWHKPLLFDSSVFFPEGHMRKLDSRHYQETVVSKIFPRIAVKAAKPSQAKKEIDAGMRKLPGVKLKMPKPCGGLVVVGPRPIDAGANDRVPIDKRAERDSGTDVGSEDGTDVSVSPDPSCSEHDSDEEPFRVAAVAARRDARARRPAMFKLYGQGQILLNNSASTIDAKCYVCDASIDRKWTRRNPAKQAHTLAQGRMMGAHLAWLTLPCDGCAATHVSLYTAADLPREQRKALRISAQSLGDLEVIFGREGPQRSDGESDGEPQGVPENRRNLG
jgi:hypothetical protein